MRLLEKRYEGLPSKVQQAIRLAQLKKKNTDFFYTLENLNDKIKVYTKIFSTGRTSFEEKWKVQKENKKIEMLSKKKLESAEKIRKTVNKKKEKQLRIQLARVSKLEKLA